MSPRLQALLVVAVLASVQWLAPQLPGVAAQATTEAVCTIDAFDWVCIYAPSPRFRYAGPTSFSPPTDVQLQEAKPLPHRSVRASPMQQRRYAVFWDTASLSLTLSADFDVPALPEGSYYVGPKNAAQANPCTCSTPVWSLLSACSHCQNATYYTGFVRVPPTPPVHLLITLQMGGLVHELHDGVY